MIRCGLLSDIHGNLALLEKALARFAEAGIDRIAVLGDNLGRGDSDACVRLVRACADVSVLGNRDLDWQDRVSAEARAYVLGLPQTVCIDGMLFAHGDARLTPDLSSNDIRHGFMRARRTMETSGACVWLFGHTHRARVWRVDDGQASATLLFDAATDPLPARIELQQAHGGASRWIINVGSVGLPFPGKGPASAAILQVEGDGRGMVDFVPL